MVGQFGARQHDARLPIGSGCNTGLPYWHMAGDGRSLADGAANLHGPADQFGAFAQIQHPEAASLVVIGRHSVYLKAYTVVGDFGNHVVVALFDDHLDKFGLSVFAGVADGFLHNLEDHVLLVGVENPFDPDAVRKQGAGVGLANVKQRIRSLYGKRADLRTSASGGLHRAELRLPCQGAAASAGT